MGNSESVFTLIDKLWLQNYHRHIKWSSFSWIMNSSTCKMLTIKFKFFPVYACIQSQNIRGAEEKKMTMLGRHLLLTQNKSTKKRYDLHTITLSYSTWWHTIAVTMATQSPENTKNILNLHTSLMTSNLLMFDFRVLPALCDSVIYLVPYALIPVSHFQPKQKLSQHTIVYHLMPRSSSAQMWTLPSLRKTSETAPEKFLLLR